MDLRFDAISERLSGILTSNANSSSLKDLDSDSITRLRDRLDTLETYVRELRGQLTARVTDKLENQMFNLTASSGIERMISMTLEKTRDNISSISENNKIAINEIQTQIMKLEDSVNTLHTMPVGTTSSPASTTVQPPTLPISTSSLAPSIFRSVDITESPANISEADLMEMLGKKDGTLNNVNDGAQSVVPPR